jgi:hypothetical protein
VSLAPVVARADDAALADVLFEEGRKLVDAGKVAEACPKFQASLDASRALGTLLNLADCLQRSGKTAAAWERWTEGLAMARERNDDRAKLAESKKLALEPEIRRLRVQVATGPEPLTVAVDGQPLDAARFGIPIAVDVEQVEVTVRRADEVLDRRRVVLNVGEVSELSLDLDAIAREHPLPQAQPVDDAGPLWLAGWITLGVGLGGVAAFGILEGVALGQRAEAEAPGGCVERSAGLRCTPQGAALVERAGDFAEAGQWAGIAGGTVAAVGLTMVLVANARASEDTDVAVVAPWIAPGSVGVMLGGTL